MCRYSSIFKEHTHTRLSAHSADLWISAAPSGQCKRSTPQHTHIFQLAPIPYSPSVQAVVVVGTLFSKRSRNRLRHNYHHLENAPVFSIWIEFKFKQCAAWQSACDCCCSPAGTFWSWRIMKVDKNMHIHAENYLKTKEFIWFSLPPIQCFSRPILIMHNEWVKRRQRSHTHTKNLLNICR